MSADEPIGHARIEEMIVLMNGKTAPAGVFDKLAEANRIIRELLDEREFFFDGFKTVKNATGKLDLENKYVKRIRRAARSRLLKRKAGDDNGKIAIER